MTKFNVLELFEAHRRRNLERVVFGAVLMPVGAAGVFALLASGWDEGCKAFIRSEWHWNAFGASRACGGAVFVGSLMVGLVAAYGAVLMLRALNRLRRY